MINEHEKLQRVIDLGIQIAQVRDVDILLERILWEARNITHADAGSIYVRDGDSLKFSYTQNDTLQRKLPQGKKLVYASFSIPINSKSIAGHAAVTAQTINLPDVYRLPPGVPFSFNRQYDDIAGYRTKSVLTVPLRMLRGEVFGVIQLINAKDASDQVITFPPEDEPMLAYFASLSALAVHHAILTRTIILRMTRMAEVHDPKETGAHVNRVAAYAVALYDLYATQAGLPKEEVDRKRDSLRMVAMLHDVGKVGISDIILKKPGRFTPEEFEIMQQHALLGARLFADALSDLDEAARDVALSHHERWDGTGYPGHIDLADGKPLPGFEGPDGKPRGKKGEEIPLFGRLVAIADVFDALCSRRCYKEPKEEEEVLRIMREGAGTQFDPNLLTILLDNMETIRHIRALYPEAQTP